jgi:hypothetical protein
MLELAFFANVLTVYYLVACLRFDAAMTQPFVNYRREVQQFLVSTNDAGDVITEVITYHPGLFDRIRFLFGLYRVSPDNSHVWVVRNERLPVWECPKCLSFWVAVVTAALTASLLNNLVFLLLIIPIAGGSTLLHAIDYSD